MTTADTAAERGTVAKLGQHFLTSDHHLTKVVEAADLSDQDRVLEIGPGTGLLTEHLLDQAAGVVAIEVDRGLASQLEIKYGHLPEERFHLIRADAAQAPWPRFDKLVSNLPYQISSPVLFRLLDEDYACAVLTLQKEFAQRLVAKPGTKAYSRLSVKTALKAKAELLFTIPPGAFSPPPKVESACVRLHPIEPPHLEDRDLFDELVDQAFNHRRKMLRVSLREIEGAPEVLEAMELPTRRPAKLSPSTWVELANHVARLRRA